MTVTCCIRLVSWESLLTEAVFFGWELSFRLRGPAIWKCLRSEESFTVFYKNVTVSFQDPGVEHHARRAGSPVRMRHSPYMVGVVENTRMLWLMKMRKSNLLLRGGWSGMGGFD